MEGNSISILTSTKFKAPGNAPSPDLGPLAWPQPRWPRSPRLSPPVPLSCAPAPLALTSKPAQDWPLPYHPGPSAHQLPPAILTPDLWAPPRALLPGTEGFSENAPRSRPVALCSSHGRPQAPPSTRGLALGSPVPGVSWLTLSTTAAAAGRGSHSPSGPPQPVPPPPRLLHVALVDSRRAHTHLAFVALRLRH